MDEPDLIKKIQYNDTGSFNDGTFQGGSERTGLGSMP